MNWKLLKIGICQCETFMYQSSTVFLCIGFSETGANKEKNKEEEEDEEKVELEKEDYKVLGELCETFQFNMRIRKTSWGRAGPSSALKLQVGID